MKVKAKLTKKPVKTSKKKVSYTPKKTAKKTTSMSNRKTTRSNTKSGAGTIIIKIDKSLLK